MCYCKTRPRLMLADARRRDDCVIVAVQLKDCLEKKDPAAIPLYLCESNLITEETLRYREK
jgi:hypothetical protein